jgi:malonate decarboxylase gamma subunit
VHWQDVAAALFPDGHSITERGDLLWGRGQSGGHTVAVVGTTRHAEFGVELTLEMARAVLDTLRRSQSEPLLFLVDTVGQRLRRRDELLGLQRYLAHLARCVELARQRGHRSLGLVYDQALSGGFLANGLMTDLCAALPGAEIRVMSLGAMARVTRIPEARLAELARHSPVFAPGAESYVKMGALDSVNPSDLSTWLKDALERAVPAGGARDARAELALARGGRLLAERVAKAVVDDA